MAQQYYSKHKNPPLTDKEIKEKYEEVLEEMKEVLEWKKEEEAKLKDSASTPQKKGVPQGHEMGKKGTAKRALKKVAWRINTINGQKLYWELRMKGESHFKANLEKNEYWEKCREEMEREEKQKEIVDLPELLRGDNFKR